MDQQEFDRHADQALSELHGRLARAGDRYGFDSDLQAGALTIEFDDPPGRFVVSPNSPVRQIWVSALTRSFKLDWDGGREAWVYPDSGETLAELIQTAIGKHTGEEITL